MKPPSCCIALLLVATAGTRASAFKYRPNSYITSAAINGAMWETAGRTYEPISSTSTATTSSRKGKSKGKNGGVGDNDDDGLPFELRVQEAVPPRDGGTVAGTIGAVVVGFTAVGLLAA
jgi:hypothetical protein